MIRKSLKRPRPEWFWRTRPDGRPAIIEQRPDGQWSVVIGRQVVGVVTSQEAAEQLIRKFDATS
jgi:hypothetical protein